MVLQSGKDGAIITNGRKKAQLALKQNQQEKRPSTGGTFSDGYILIVNVSRTSLSADEP